jgi:hypothetical protein
MTANIFFVNKILFFLMLSHKICFMAIKSPPGQSYSTNIHGIQRDLPVLSPLWLLHYKGTCGWGNCAPKILIESLPGGPLVNLASPNKHIPKIK